MLINLILVFFLSLWAMPLSAARPQCGYLGGALGSVAVTVGSKATEVHCNFDAGAMLAGPHTIDVYARIPAQGAGVRIRFSFGTLAPRY